MLKIKWYDKISNEEVLERMGTGRKFWSSITKRRNELIGHILRCNGLVKTIIEGCIEERRNEGRLWLFYVHQIIKNVRYGSDTEMRKGQEIADWSSATNQSLDWQQTKKIAQLNASICIHNYIPVDSFADGGRKLIREKKVS